MTAMTHHAETPDIWTDEQVAERLMSLSDSTEFNRMLHYRQDRINIGVIRRFKDEVAHLIHADVHRAVELAEMTQAAAALSDDPLAEAVAQHTQALALQFSGQHVAAIEAYERAESIYTSLGMDVEAARITRARVSVLMLLGQYEEALQAADKARQIFQQHQQPILLAQLESNVGGIYHRLDRYREALDFYERARRIFAAHQDELGLAHIDYNSANQYTQLNEFNQALALYQEARRRYEKLGMPRSVNQTEYAIAWLYFLRGRFHESLKLFAAARTKANELGDAPLVALCDLDLAEVYLQLNVYEDAVESARQAAEEFLSLTMNYEYAKANMYLGLARMHQGDFPAAARELREARRVFMAEGNEVYTALTDIYLSDVLTHQRDFEQAWRLCAEAKRLFQEQKLASKAACAELQLARLKLLKGCVDEAQSLCQSALQSIDEIEAPWLKYHCFHLLGRSMQYRGQAHEAYQYYLWAIEQLEAMRSRIRVDEFKCTFLKDKLRVYEDMVDLCLRAGTEEKIAEAFAVAEAAKSRSLVDLLASDQKIGATNSEPARHILRQEWVTLLEELHWYYNQMNQYETRVDRRPGWLGTKLQAEVRQREHQLTKLARQLRLEDDDYASLQTVARLDPAQVRARLAEDEVLVEYYTVKGQIQMFVMSREGVHGFHNVSKRPTVAPVLKRLRFYLDAFTFHENYVNTHTEQVHTLTRQSLTRLYEELIQPIAPFLEGKKIIFVPHDLLHYVPFHALYDGREYLIDRHEISYCPSASVFNLCLEKASSRRMDGSALIMGIADEATPFIRDEIATVSALWPGAYVFAGEAATLDRLKHYAPTCRLLHLASHGTFRRDNPMFSALKLSDGWLSFYDIFDLTLKADLVTLSACETGINEVFPGDELFGLMRGFLYAGAASLLVSLWMVNDRSAATCMKLFYAGLKDGLSKRAALRKAQLGVKQEYSHPYFWAPFILMGAPV